MFVLKHFLRDTMHARRAPHLSSIAEIERALREKSEALERAQRELRIEASIDRVRTVALTMRAPTEILTVCTTLYNELRSLGFEDLRNAMVNIHHDDRGVFQDYDYSGTVGPSLTTVPYDDGHPAVAKYLQQVRKGADAFAEFAISVQEMEHWREFRRRTGQADDPALNEGAALYYYFYSIESGSIGISKFSVASPGQLELLRRFRNVFDFAYRRYMDLSIVEAHLRESQIEAAMERVRARAMAMHSSTDLAAATAVIFTELRKLGIEPVRCGVVLLSKDSREARAFTTSAAAGNDSLALVGSFQLSGHPSFEEQYRSWVRQENYFTTIGGEALRSRYELLRAGLPVPYLPPEQGDHEEHGYFFSFTEGQLYVWSQERYLPEALAILDRFKAIIALTFRRYLDLQRAEAQAREAQIEASLERVRAVAMSMMKSDDLLNVCKSVFTQLKGLGFAHMRNAQIYISDDPKGRFQNYNYSDHVGEEIVEVQFDSHPHVKRFHDAIHQARDAFAHYEIDGADLEEWRSYLNITLAQKPDKELETASGLHYYFYSIGAGALGICTFEPIVEEELRILKRFRNVFDLSYQRYSDIALAEAQSREAQIEVSLERVRSRTLAMQSSDELAETAAVLFRQLIMLGIAPNRLYIAIIKDDVGNAEFWITDEDGGKVSSGFAANLRDNPTFTKMLRGLEAGEKSITINMQGEELREYFRHLATLNVPFKGGLSQKRRVQSIAYFSKGFIGIASPAEQTEATTKLLERFAAVFNLTITRFHDLLLAEAQARRSQQDLIQLQAANKEAEEALAELRSTQEQLVQREKLASLGQLTAGIAHEIKNPLNFVTNFSALSAEMVDEVIETVNGASTSFDREGVVALLGDIRGNLAKINEHGSRADGIVKSMLYHSRGGSGKLEPGDLNALIREFVNLAYHGMRAGKNPIAPAIEFDLDASVGKVNLMAEEFSRVIVNICQNAFDAMREKGIAEDREDGSGTFVPRLLLRSRRQAQNVTVEIEDNGPGVPVDIRDKILQPFFTTKKGKQGTGLGLSIAHDIVRAHRGTLTFDNNHQGGTTFRIMLPV